MSILAFPESIPVTPTLHAEVITITPAMAEQLLAKNTHNRNPKSSNLKKVVRALENGEWKLNGEAIKIAKDGTILDGQHRLLGIVQTGVSMTTLVIRGLDNETQETMDGGSPRSAADALRLRGEANAVTLASIAKKVRVANSNGIKAAASNSYVLTTAEILRTVDEIEGLRDIAKDANRVSMHTGLSASLAGLLMYTFYNIDPQDADFFFERLATGELLAKGHPIYELRRVLSEVKKIRGQKSMTFVAAVCIKAWNKYRDGETVTLLKFTVGGANPEAFPEPK